MIPKKASIPGPYSIQHLAPPRQTPSIVFSRDDASGAGKASAVPSRILIVEDEFLVAFDMGAALTEAGFRLSGLRVRQKKLSNSQKHTDPALAVMDIRLAGQRDGIDAALELVRDLRNSLCVCDGPS